MLESNNIHGASDAEHMSKEDVRRHPAGLLSGAVAFCDIQRVCASSSTGFQWFKYVCTGKCMVDNLNATIEC